MEKLFPSYEVLFHLPTESLLGNMVLASDPGDPDWLLGGAQLHGLCGQKGRNLWLNCRSGGIKFDSTI